MGICYSFLYSNCSAFSRLFQLHGGIISHMLVLATPSSTVHNTKYLDPTDVVM